MHNKTPSKKHSMVAFSTRSRPAKLALLITFTLMFAVTLITQAQARSLPNYVDLVAKNAPAVVNITSIRKPPPQNKQELPNGEEVPEFFKHFFKNL